MEEVLTATYWFDSGDEGERYAVTISFSGRRRGVTGKPQPGDRFAQEQTYEGIVPGSGPVAVTTKVQGINPGEWTVTARPVKRGRGGRVRPYIPLSPGAVNAGRPMWPRRQPAIPSGQSTRAETALAPFAPTPGIKQLVWGPLVLLGIAVGFVVQALLLARAHRDVAAALAVSGFAVLAGWIGAKAWYIAVHRGQRFDGWCIQGAILGGALAAAAVPVFRLDVSAGSYLNAAAPGLMLGIAIGKPGCFWAGCCTGRPTTSRWGIWSSDRQIGIRRIPTQLLESLLALGIGAVVLIVALSRGLGGPGGLFVGAFASYTLGRQLILPLRDEPRRTSIGGPLTIAISALVLVAEVVLSTLG